MSAIFASFFCFIVISSAQEMTISLQGDVENVETDLDAKTYFPVSDQNDNLCALLKVTLANQLQNELVLSTGGLSVVKREEKADGEIWFYVPHQVKNLTFTCKGYAKMPPVPVTLKAGQVYRLTIASDAEFVTVSTAAVKSNYLKMNIIPSDAMISIGKTHDYEIATEMLSDGNFVKLLDFGTYCYKIEHNLYEPETGTVSVGTSNDVIAIRLKPNFNTLTINSLPDNGADVLINGEHKGTTPLITEEKFRKGTYTVRLLHRDYRPSERIVTLSGDGSNVKCNISMIPLYATVTCMAEDKTAEIWIDNQYKGTGSWTGRVSGDVTHVLEARKANHQSQSKSFSAAPGETLTELVGAPVPLYATLNIETEPLMADVTIDGNVVGSAPLVMQVLMGAHEVKVSKSGYNPIIEHVELQHNENRTIKVVLEKSSAIGYSGIASAAIPPMDLSHGKYGKDSAECVKYLSYYKEYYKIKDYDNAYPYWEQAFAVCPPQASQQMIIDGTSLIRDKISNTSDEKEKLDLVNRLFYLHDVRAAYYPKYAATAMGNKALDALNYVRDYSADLFRILGTAVKCNKDKTRLIIVYYWVQTGRELHVKDIISDGEWNAVVETIRLMSVKPKTENDAGLLEEIGRMIEVPEYGGAPETPQESSYSEEDPIPYQQVEDKPSFMGGDANAFSVWVNQHLEYPEIAKENGVQGRVTLQFTVEIDGSITNVSVLRGVDASLDNEAVRVVSSSPKWTPGKIDGSPVRVTYTFPVVFQLL